MLEFNNVSFKYSNSDDYVLKNISFKINKGTWTTIIGSNGSGKSTIMKLLYGQHVPTSGEIYINKVKYNENISTLDNNLAVVFQNPDNQFVGSTVEEDIAFGLENVNIPQEEMENIISSNLKIVDMLDYRKSEPRELSGGQKQRVAIASVLATNPKILLLDEATSMLDPLAKKNILEYIKNINKNNDITIISITHDLEELAYSNDVFLIDNGIIVEKINNSELLNKRDIFQKYNMELPFLYKLKNDINKLTNNDIFCYNDNMEEFINKICKLILKI